MNHIVLDRWLPARPTTFSTREDALFLAVGLLVGLVGVVPTFTLTVQRFGLAIPVPALLGTGTVLVAYAIAVVLIRQISVGTLVALVVLSTFNADVPLPGLDAQFLGAPDFSLWLFEPALFIGLGIAVYERWDRDATLTRTHAVFAGFVAWTFVAAIFGAGPRPDAAVAFAFHFLIGLLVFTFVAAAIERGATDLRMIVILLFIAVLAQAAFAVAQLIHGEPFGLSRLGEVGRVSSTFINIGTMQIRIGVHLSGLTGRGSALSALSLLVAPAALLYVILVPERRYTRAAVGVATIGLFTLVRLTVKDAARGAALLALAAVVVSFVLSVGPRALIPPRMLTLKRRFVGGAVAIVAALAVLLYPLSQSGGGVNIPSTNGGGGSSSSEAGNGAGAGNSVSAGGDASSLPDLSSMEGIHIPFFNIQSLGIRLQQYFAAIDLIAHYPLFGLGGANFPYIAVERYGIRPAGRFISGPIANAIHNAYLAVLAGTGVPGFVLFCATLAGIAWTGVRLVRHQVLPAWLGFGLLCGFIGYFAYIFWAIVITTPVGATPFWILAGAVVGTNVKQTQ